MPKLNCSILYSKDKEFSILFCNLMKVEVELKSSYYGLKDLKNLLKVNG